MPIEQVKLKPEEVELLKRVESYCSEGLDQRQMARREKLTVGGFRARVLRCGYEIDHQTTRRLVRLRSKIPFHPSQISIDFETPAACGGA